MGRSVACRHANDTRGAARHRAGAPRRRGNGHQLHGDGPRGGRGARALERRRTGQGRIAAPALRRCRCRRHPHQHVRLQPPPLDAARGRAPRGRAGAGRGHDRRRGRRGVEPAGGGRRLGRTHRRAVRAARRADRGGGGRRVRASRSPDCATGGADVAWIETMSAPEEVRAAARAAIAVGVPVRRDVLVRHRRAHDDGAARRATRRRVRRARRAAGRDRRQLRRRARPTSWCRCWR